MIDAFSAEAHKDAKLGEEDYDAILDYFTKRNRHTLSFVELENIARSIWVGTPNASTAFAREPQSEVRRAFQELTESDSVEPKARVRGLFRKCGA